MQGKPVQIKTLSQNNNNKIPWNYHIPLIRYGLFLPKGLSVGSLVLSVVILSGGGTVKTWDLWGHCLQK